MNIDSLLQSLGFTAAEQKVFITLVTNGPLTATHISQTTRIQRTSVYPILQKLIAAGFIIESTVGAKKIFSPRAYDELETTIRAEERALQKKKESIHSLAKELRREQSSTTDGLESTVRHIDSDRITDFLYMEAEKWDKSARKIDSTWWGFQDAEFAKTYDEWIRWLWKDVYTQTTTVRLLSNHTALEAYLAKRYSRRKIKYISKNIYTATTWVVGEYVIMVNTTLRRPYAVEIHDPLLANNMRASFRLLWDTLD